MAKLDLTTLKKQLLAKQKAEKAAAKKARIQKQRDKHEQTLFQQAMSDVAPLKQDKVYHDNNKPVARRIEKRIDDENARSEFHDPFSDEQDIMDVKPEEILSFCRNGIQKSAFRKLRSGALHICDELDLHGATLKQAKQMLVYFLQETIQIENCCVRVIHGKGQRSKNNKPVLKSHVNRWLSEHERVLAFHSAKPKDGGSGALYVLLKR